MAIFETPNFSKIKAVPNGNSYVICTFKNKFVNNVRKPIVGDTKI